MVNTLLAFTSGLLLWLGFAPVQNWVAPFIGIAILFRILLDKSVRERFLFSLIAGLSFFLPLLHWSSVYVGSIPWLVLAVGESAIFSLIALFSWTRKWESALSFSLMFTLIEIIRMKFPFGGFGWGRVGFTQVDSLSAWYPFLGVTGISLLVATASFSVLSLRVSPIFLLFALSISFFFDDSGNSKADETIEITAIQGGVDDLGLDFNSRALRVLQRHAQATHKVPDSDLYIWPENASDVDPLKNSQARKLIKDVVSRIQAPLLIGAVEESDQGPINSSLLFNTETEVVSKYIKQDLAPFGEYMPVRKLAEAISPYAKRVNDFLPGSSWVKHSINGVPFQSLICFEVLDDDHSKKGAGGAAFLVAQTNNATFGKSYEAAQQLQITRARAAESGRNIAVVSTTGFTAHIDSSGKILSKAEQFAAQSLTMNLALENPAKITWAQRTSSGIWAIGLMLMFALCRVKLRR
jgi:apolipoprotein N-acyltransferase